MFEIHTDQISLFIWISFSFKPYSDWAFLAVPGLGGGGGGAFDAPRFHYLKTIEDINMRLAALIKRREINLLLLLYSAVTSHDVTESPSWIFMAAILDFRTSSKRRQHLFFCLKFVEYLH